MRAKRDHEDCITGPRKELRPLQRVGAAPFVSMEQQNGRSAGRSLDEPGSDLQPVTGPKPVFLDRPPGDPRGWLVEASPRPSSQPEGHYRAGEQPEKCE